MSTRWAPPLPLVGRTGPRIDVPQGTSLKRKLELYFLDQTRSQNFFHRFLARHEYSRFGYRNLIVQIAGGNRPARLAECHHWFQYQYILKQLYFNLSANFRWRLFDHLEHGRIGSVEQWFLTATGCVLPLLLSGCEDTEQIDQIVKWSLENCANSYAQFIARLKRAKKLIRKAYATNSQINWLSEGLRDMYTYYKVAKPFLNSAEAVLLWTQTRATGLADGAMMRQSLNKFVETITLPPKRVEMNEGILLSLTRPLQNADAGYGHIVSGPAACLGRLKSQGGQTSFVWSLCRQNVLHRRYNLFDLSYEEISPRPCRSSHDLLSWAVQTVHEHPTLVRIVRAHAVSEPSKARVITVAHMAYQMICAFASQILMPGLRRKQVRSGLKAERHLWNFLTDNLGPMSREWEHFPEGGSWLCYDFSEATDWMDVSVARQVLNICINQCNFSTGVPMGILALAKSLYISKRFVFVPHGRKYSLHIKTRGCFMGDYLTKVVLTVAHDYSLSLSGLRIYSIVGDDGILYGLLDDIHRAIRNLKKIFKLSDDDTYITQRLIFYCEEGAVPPKSPWDAIHPRMKRGEPLGYIDYPRIRLLLPCTSETMKYSSTNLGRFSLLGKESRWTHSVNSTLWPAFGLAILLQHILVPKDFDTLCPFLPMEIGGDGSFYPDPNFLKEVVESGWCKDSREARFRAGSLLDGSNPYKVIRSERPNNVVHRHHILTPLCEELKQYLPENSLIVPKDKDHAVLLGSLRGGFNLMESTEALFKHAEKVFWSALLNGEPLPEMKFSCSRVFNHPRTEKYVSWSNFLRIWANPGFKFRDVGRYWVIRDLYSDNMPKYVFPRNPHNNVDLQDWGLDNISDIELVYEQLYDFVVHGHSGGAHVPPSIQQRMNLCVESDSYILLSLQGKPFIPRLVLVSCDARLAFRIVSEGLAGEVCLMHPGYYWYGKVTDVEKAWPHTEVIEDVGALYYFRVVEMSHYERDMDASGLDPFDDYNLDVKSHHRYPGVFVTYGASVRSDRKQFMKYEPYVPPHMRG